MSVQQQFIKQFSDQLQQPNIITDNKYQSNAKAQTLFSLKSKSPREYVARTNNH